MGLRYYLRGLGLGIIITAILMIVSSGGKKAEMTDAQIIARAKELGMVDGVLTELPGEEQTEQGDEGADAEQTPAADHGGNDGKAVKAQEPENSEEPLDHGGNDEGTADGGATEKTAGEASANRTETFTATVSIYPGEGSYMVSRKLAELGLVESADIYDRFLCQNGYDKKLCTDNYEIRSGSTAEEIARIITKSR